MFRSTGLGLVCALSLWGCVSSTDVPWDGESITPTPSPTPTVNPQDYAYERPITVDAAGFSVPAGYAVSVDLDIDPLITSGKLQDTGADLRVTYKGGEVPFVIDPNDNWTENTVTFFFPLVEALPASGSTDQYSFFYGDVDALKPAYEMTDVVSFYDDLESGDLSGWGPAVLGDGVIEISEARAWSGNYSIRVLGGAFLPETRSQTHSMRGSMELWLPGNFDDTVMLVTLLLEGIPQIHFGLDATNDPTVFDAMGQPVYTLGNAVPRTRWHTVGFAVDADNNEVALWRDNTAGGPSAFSAGVFDEVRIGANGKGVFTEFWIDDWTYRPWLPGEPTASVGEEIPLGGQ